MKKKQKEVFIGLMLGDGFLEKHKNGKNACLRIARKREDKKYIELHAAIFQEYNPRCRDGQIFDKRTDKIYYQSYLRTPVNIEFTKLHSKWYPNGKKVVPLNLKLTPLSLATWFADDGSIKIAKRIYDVKLATNGFLQKEVIFLQKLLLDTFSLRFKIYEDKSGKSKQWTMRLTNKKDVRDFVKIIDSVFPKGMERKSDIWRNNMDLLAEKIYPNCKFCNSNNVYKNGSDNGGSQKYLCKDCKRQFTH
jgi:hypothetical protein